MEKIKIYIASAYTKEDAAINVRLQMEAANILMNADFVPFVPLYFHFQHMMFPRPYEDWIEMDLEWVKVCDILIRIRSRDKKNKEITSSGADQEVKYAKENNILIFEFNSLDRLEKWCKNANKQNLLSLIKLHKKIT